MLFWRCFFIYIKEELVVDFNNEKVIIYVLDIFKFKNKNYVLYLISKDRENIYSSVVNYKGDILELLEISGKEEIFFVNQKIKEYKEKVMQ